MKESGMLFSAPMVRALLDGSKTQTRRLVKPQPMESDGQTYGGKIFGPEMYEPAAYDKHGEMVPGPEIFGIYTEDGDWGVKCPYGKPGDRIWVREAFRAHSQYDKKPPREINAGSCLLYEADDDTAKFPWAGKYRPPMFMPRWASRIDLEITGVRVERLQDISEADAIAEGIESAFDGTRWRMYDHRDGEEYSQYAGPRWTIDPVRSYKSLWLSLNGPGSWDANQWVWVIEFKRL